MAERNFSAQLAGKFVDDDDLVRTGRAWVEIDGFDFLHIPVPKGFENTLDIFETQADQVAKDAASSGKYASAAKSSASAAASSASKAAGSESSSARDATAAKDGATRAETAASNAKTSETQASSSASAAKSSASAASSSASKAATSEQNAAKSASAAATSAAGAKQDADRAANIASSTSWSGDKLTVNGKTSPSLTGPKGDPGDVSKAQLDTAIEAVKATISRAKPVYFTTDDGSEWYIVGGTPAGWRTWAAGRIYPPAGKYWVEISDGVTAENRPTQAGVSLKQASMATITDGDYLLALYSKPGHTIKITPIT